jgi:type IV fimbrial biogenesis protein FimT
MTVVLILAILLAVAVPNLIPFIVKNSIAGNVNNLVASIHYARSEAIKRGVPVSICRTSSAAARSCMTAGQVWDTGWMVFVNDSSATTIAVDKILRRFEAVNAPYYITARGGGVNGGLGRVTWGAMGDLLNSGVGIGAAHFSVGSLAKGYSGLEYIRYVCLSAGGRPRLAAGDASDCGK